VDLLFEIIRLLLLSLTAALIGMFCFTLIFYMFDNYWIEQQQQQQQPSSWFNFENETNF